MICSKFLPVQQHCGKSWDKSWGRGAERNKLGKEIWAAGPADNSSARPIRHHVAELLSVFRLTHEMVIARNNPPRVSQSSPCA